MALRAVASRCRHRLWRNSASASASASASPSSQLLWRTEWVSSQILRRTELWANPGWNERQQQQRFYARVAAETQQKVATPNAAKNVKAKNATKKEEKKEQRERFNDLIDACLNAPSPLSPLKEKDRLRLLERERLGVVSQERLREIEQEKARGKLAKAAKKKEAKAKPVEVISEEQIGEAGTLTSEAKTAQEALIVLTSEEGRRLAKECSRVLMKEDRERAKGEAVRLQLKKEALAALPQHLREAALVPDLTPLPKSRIPASLTPPIRGYIDDRASAAAQAVTVKKSR